MKWGMLLLQTEDQAGVAQALMNAFQGVGLTPYDPFPGGAGTPISFKTFQRQFVTPAHEGWVRIMGDAAIHFGTDFGPSLSAVGPLLLLGFDSENAEVQAFSRGEAASLNAFLKPDTPLEKLSQVLHGTLPDGPAPGSAPLPDELADFARQHGVEPGKVSGLMNRMSGIVFGKLNRQSGGEAGRLREQAGALMGSAGPDWNSSGGRRLSAAADLLTLPSVWRTPSFESVRDAYQVARRLERSPHASLMPDERAAYQAIPHVLAYVPVYVGK